MVSSVTANSTVQSKPQSAVVNSSTQSNNQTTTKIPEAQASVATTVVTQGNESPFKIDWSSQKKQ